MSELKRCLDTLLKQSYNDYEIIVVDDGSSDGTKELVKQYKKIKYFKQNNKGPGYARNKGIKYARGNIIAFTDDDCIPDKNWLKNAVPHFKDPNTIGVEGMTIKKGLITPTSIPTINYYGKQYSTCNIFYRTSVLKGVSGFNEAFKFSGEDDNLAQRALKIGIINFDPSVKIIHPVKYYSVLGFLKKHIDLKITYWQVLGSKESKKLYSWESVILYPFYAGLLFAILSPNVYSLILLGYIYLTTVLFHDLYLTKGRVLDIFRYKKTLIKLTLVWWIIIITDALFRIWGMIRFRRLML